MINLSWAAFNDATADSFNVYRSIPGLTIAFPNTLAIGDILTFAATSLDQQNITFTAIDIDSVVSQFNAAAKGAYAVKDTGGTNILIRTTATQKAKLKLYPCTFLTNTSQAVRMIVPSLEWVMIANVPFVLNTFDYTYDDPDGTELDAYRITSVVSAVESLPSLIQFPQIGTDSLCAIEGAVFDTMNHPVKGMAITAIPRLYETSSDSHWVDSHGVRVYTDSFGRFTLYLSRKAIYLLQIPNVGYNETVCVPDQPAAGFIDLIPTLAGRFSPFGDPQ